MGKDQGAERVVIQVGKEGVYPHYEKLVVKTLSMMNDNPIVLKTDLCNETRDKRCFADYTKNWFFLEIDRKICISAREKYPSLNVIEGDIRHLVFKNDLFDGIIDLSTIDHVQEYRQVLDEYRRTLKFKGIMLLIVWLNETLIIKPGQICFKKDEFIGELGVRFGIREQGVFRGALGAEGELNYFICGS
jgi:SAM-dependent methyltransferase